MSQILGSDGMVTLIHFTFFQGVDQDIVWRIACMPNMTEFHQTMYHPSVPRSNDVRAVTCPACKKTQVFIESSKILDTALRRISRA